MQEYYFNNISEVENFLNTVDVFVPLRSQARKTKHTEWYSIIKLLSQLKSEIFIDFPIKLVYADKPDFRIKSNSKTIGIEVTECIPEQLARAITLLEKRYPKGWLFEPDFFGWDAPKRTNKEIEDIFKKSNKNKKLIGAGFYGKVVENNWIKGILKSIMKKTIKLNKTEFQKYDYNWLLIYDNQIRPFLDRNYIKDNMPIIIKEYFEKTEETNFDKIIIESGSFFYTITKIEFSIIDIDK